MSTTVIVPTVSCPTCPLCFRANTPLRLRWRYCLSITRTLSNWLHVTTQAVTHRLSNSNNNDNNNSNSNAAQGAEYVSTHDTEAWSRIRSTARELPFAEKPDIRREALHNLEHLLHSRVVGQSHMIPALLEALRRKLWYSREPLVLHLAGDNGVGKTHTARLISQALSLRCSDDRGICEAGDNLLVVSGTAFDGLSVRQARRRIVHQIMRHARRYPHGVVLIDDLTAMRPALVRALSPLFGRATHFPEQMLSGEEERERESLDTRTRAEVNVTTLHSSSHDHHEEGNKDEEDEECMDADVDVENEQEGEETAHHRTRTTRVTHASHRHRRERTPPGARTSAPLPLSTISSSSSLFSAHAPPPPPPLSQLLVIVTTDFGQQGRTAGMSLRQIGELVRSEFAEIYGNFLPAYTRTLVYLPFTTDTAAAMVRSVVRTLPCALGEHVLRASEIEETAVHFLVERHRDMWQGAENGHALRRVMEDELVSQVLYYWDEKGVDSRLTAYFVLDEERARVVLREVGSGLEERHDDEAQTL